MAIDLVTKFATKVDEIFTQESKRDLLTNRDYDWDGAHTVKVYKVSTVEMTDYDRAGTGGKVSRYGDSGALNATTEELTLKKDRSFTFTIDKLDTDETGNVLNGAGALARQEREVIIPEVDAYTYGVIIDNAGTKPAEVELTADNIYDEILKATEALDNALVPETSRVLVVTPDIYRIMKKSTEIVLDSDIGEKMRLKGVIGTLDGMTVIKVPAVRLPEGFGFLVAHPCATIAPVKLEDCKLHQDPPGISGCLVEGRVVYDAFVLDNKKKAIYYQAVPTA